MLDHRLPGVPRGRDGLASGVGKAIALPRGRRLETGVPGLDALLPGGLEAGTLVDLHADEGAGALALALSIAARQQRPGSARAVALVDAGGELYPPAAARAGLDLARCVLLRPGPREVVPCLDEVLRSKAIAAVVAPVVGLDGLASHRLRVAAHAGGGLGLFVRPSDERRAISGAAVRLWAVRRDGGLVLVPLRIRGADDDGRALRVAP